jgi:hypothetical protein
MRDVFISYARQDEVRARQLRHVLDRCGWSVWWDQDLVPGQRWDDGIDRELRAAGVVLVLWSKSSIDSEFIRVEATLAREQGKLLPVTIDGTLPRIGFMQRQIEDLSSWDGVDPHHPGLRRVLSGIRNVLKISNDPNLSMRERVVVLNTPAARTTSPTSTAAKRQPLSVMRLIVIGILIAWLAAGVGWVVQYVRSGAP